MKKYPRISDYLQARHPKVYDIIENLAMQGSLSPRRGGGITFLLPDTALIAKINKLIESESPEDATDIVSSLIITEYLPTVKEFASMKDDIPTLLGKKLGVKSVGATKVDIEGGVLTPDSGFKPFGRVGNAQRGNMAVWELKGEVDYKKASATNGGAGRRGKKRGGAEHVSGGATQVEIDKFVQDVVNAEYQSIRNANPNEKRRSPMLRAVVNQMMAWKGTVQYNKARAILSLNPIISFFLIYKNRLYFPASVLTAVSTTGPDDAVDKLKEIMNDTSGESLVLSDPRKVKEEVRRLKEDHPVKVTMPETIRNMYKVVDTENKIGQLSNVYPAAAVENFQAKPGLHLLIDEFRHFLYASIKKMNHSNNAREEAEAFNDLVRNVNAFRSLTQPGSTSMDKPDILDKAKDVMQVKGPFWHTFALYTPCPWFDSQYDYAYTGAAEDDEEEEDREAELAKDLDKIHEPGTGYSELAKQIAGVVKDEDARKELEEALVNEGVKCEFHAD
jgi:hypothetical protein